VGPGSVDETFPDGEIRPTPARWWALPRSARKTSGRPSKRRSRRNRSGGDAGAQAGRGPGQGAGFSRHGRFRRARHGRREEGRPCPSRRPRSAHDQHPSATSAARARACRRAIPSERPASSSTPSRRAGVVGLHPLELPHRHPGLESWRPPHRRNAVVLKPSGLAPLCLAAPDGDPGRGGVTQGPVNMVTARLRRRRRAGEQPGGAGGLLHRFESTGAQIGLDRQAARAGATRDGGKNRPSCSKDGRPGRGGGGGGDAAFFSTSKVTATSRVIVEEPLLESFTRALVDRVERMKVGNGLEAGVDLGPIGSTTASYERFSSTSTSARRRAHGS